MKFYLPFFIFCLMTIQQLSGQDSAKIALIQNLIEVQGLKENFTKSANMFLEMKKMDEEYIDVDAWALLSDEYINSATQEIIDSLAPIYDKYYNTMNLEDLVSFYSSETGQKVVNSQVEFAQDLMKSSRNWSNQLATKLEVEWNALSEKQFTINLKGCEHLKNGKFKKPDMDEEGFQIIRKDASEIRNTFIGELNYSIEWTKDCQYKLIPSDENSTEAIEIYNIYEYGDDYYKFVVKNGAEYRRGIFKKTE